MANDDFNWDEVLVVTKPDSKEVEVSFKRVDGGGFFQNEAGPGTPPGTTEDPDGCRNTATLYSEDVFAFQSNQPHYVWLLLKHPPVEYMEVDIQFSDGDMTYPDYTTQSLTYVIQPGSWENDGNGWYGKKVPLLTGDLSAKIDLGTDSGLYYAAITAVRNFGADSCFSPTTVTINFGPAPAESDPPPAEGGGGNPVDPDPDPECEPGQDCNARWDRTESFTGNFDSILFLREAYTADAGGNYDGFFSNATNVANNSGRNSNHFVLENADRTSVIFDGTDTSTAPDMEGNASPFLVVTNPLVYPSGVNANPTKVGSWTNKGTTVGNQVYASTNDAYWEHYKNAGGLASCDNEYFIAAPMSSSRDWDIVNANRLQAGQSVWPVFAQVPDPTNVPEIAKAPSGTEFSVEEWFSVFLPKPYLANRTGYSHVQTGFTLDNASYPLVQATTFGAAKSYVHNGIFGGNDYQQGSLLSTVRVTAASGGTFRYLGSQGAGGQGTFDSPFVLPDRDLDGWFTVKIESYWKSEYKDNNIDGDYGLYDFGVTQYHQKFATWYFNGQQVTPRHLTNNFTRPTGYDTSKPVEEQLHLDFASKNYMRGGLPMYSVGHANATWVTYPIEYASRFIPSFGTGTTNKVNKNSNAGGISYISQTSGYVVPVIAYVDHSDIANQFWETDQYKNMRLSFNKSIPDYCARRP